MCFICHVCIDRYVEKYALSERFRTVLLCRILKPGERFRMVLLSSKLKNGSERFRTIPELLPILGRIERNGSERFPVFFPKKSKNGSERFQMSRIQYATFEEFFQKHATYGQIRKAIWIMNIQRCLGKNIRRLKSSATVLVIIFHVSSFWSPSLRPARPTRQKARQGTLRMKKWPRNRSEPFHEGFATNIDKKRSKLCSTR